MDWKRIFWRLQNIKTSWVRYVIYLLLTLIYVIVSFRWSTDANFDPKQFFTTTTAVAGIVILVSELLAWGFSFGIQKLLEDSTKLTEDFDDIMNKYKRVKLIEYGRARFPGEELAFRGKDSNPFHFEFNHEMKWKSFEVPKQIKDRSTELMKAHDCSKVFNNINVRLEDCQQFGSTVKLTYSKTMYYDLLITNRAMDYPLEVEKGHTVKSVRQIYEPGPFLSPLSKSKLSNHLGFNGFVELADGNIIFVLRNADVSVGKRRWNPSVSASYKTEYGLNDKREMSAKCMGTAIRREIADELKISVGKNERLEDCIFAFYRDLVEGGKPHFVFYYRVSDPIWTKEYFEEHFKEESRKRKAAKKRRRMSKEERNKFDMIEDGDYFAFFSLNELKNSVISANQLTVSRGKPLKMQSDGSISLALFLKYLTNVENRTKTLIHNWIQKSVTTEGKQMSADEVDKLSKMLTQILWGETAVEDAAYSSDDFITAEALEAWKKKAETLLESVLSHSPAENQAQERDSKLAKRSKGKNTNGTR